MKTQALNVNGAVIFWTLGEDTDREKLLEGLKVIGLETLCPEENTSKLALKTALIKVFGGRRTLIRPMMNRDGYEVVVEKQSTTGTSLDHEILFTVKTPGKGEGINFRNSDGSLSDPTKFGPEQDSVRCQFDRSLDLIPSTKIARSLKLLVEHLKGFSLRDMGGVYYVPESGISKLASFAQAVEAASPGGRNVVYRINAAMDDDCFRTVVDALANSIAKEMGVIRNDIKSGKIGQRAIKSKVRRTEELQTRIAEYETVFNVSLDKIKEETEDLDTAKTWTALASFAGLLK